jgi:hypothetical protein
VPYEIQMLGMVQILLVLGSGLDKSYICHNLVFLFVGIQPLTNVG